MHFDLTVDKVTTAQLDRGVIDYDLEQIGLKCKKPAHFKLRWVVHKDSVKEEKLTSGNWRYSATIRVKKGTYRSADAVLEQFKHVREAMRQAAHRNAWHISDAALPAVPTTSESVVVVATPPKNQQPTKSFDILKRNDFNLPLLNDAALKGPFSGLYNRDRQIRMIYDIMRTAKLTEFRELGHCLLTGPAGTAKSKIFYRFRDWIGKDNVWKVDGTTMSKAGLENKLIEMAQDGTLPPVVWIEEIEKVTEEKTINCLLQVLADGKVQKTGGRIGSIEADCRSVFWATCNDSDLLRTFAKGAIWSRFSCKPICKRPGPTTMRAILTDVVKDTDGRVEWVDIVVKFLWDEVKKFEKCKNDYNDPRLARAILAARERLEDTSSKGALADWRWTLKAQEHEEEEEELEDA